MSIIAWDGITLAVDRAATINSTIQETSKSRQLENGAVLAWCRVLESGMVLANWYENGANPDDWPECQSGKEWGNLIVVNGLGCFEYEKLYIAQPIIAKHFAWGTGAELALGAMAAGANAETAARIACKHDANCGMGVDTYRYPAAP
ncbi:MAG TPA: hypothetical protein ENJ35_04285 [Gammaproteobacteria bacterium]|nr:hypothetical protein [Gammaproteobacteria bacterium]